MKQEKATQVNGCKQCKKGLSNTQKWLFGLSFYILLSSIYGTIKFLQFLSNFL